MSLRIRSMDRYIERKSRREDKAPERLERIAKNNLSYVIRMLNSTATLQSDSTIENYAFLESFLIHARILIEFLYRGPTKKDTILAEDYVDNWKTYKGGADQLSIKYLNFEKRRMNKLLAHLTEEGSMSEGEHKKWDRMRICNEINKGIIFFLDAPGNKISEEVKSQIRESTGPKGVPYDHGFKGVIGATGPFS